VSTKARQEDERRSEIENTARVYEDAIARGVPPIKEVMDRLGLTKPTAIRRIRAARDSGVLPEDARPNHSQKLVAVAQALEVDPDKLVDAILEHADGDLRVQRRGSNDTFHVATTFSTDED
jgi:hypothetical protein